MDDKLTHSSSPTVIYDGACDICRHLAFRIRTASDDSLGTVPLQSDDAEQLLARFYPDGHDHDFYYVADDNCWKGVRALPRIAKATDMREFADIVREYARYKAGSVVANGGGCGSDRSTGATTVADSARSLTRRAFAGALGAGAATLVAGSSLASGSSDDWAPPADLQINVVTVTEDGDGGYETTLEQRPDLIRDEKPYSSDDGGGRRRKGQRRGGNEQSEPEPIMDTETLSAQSLGENTEAKLEEMKLLSRTDDSDSDVARALEASSVDDSLSEQRDDFSDTAGQISIYEATLESDLFTYRLSAGRGPAVSQDGDPEVVTSMTSEVNHFFTDSIADYVKTDIQPATVQEHVEAYLAGIERLSAYHADGSFDRFPQLADELKDTLRHSKQQFAEVDRELEVVGQTTLSISGLPKSVEYVETEAIEKKKKKGWIGPNCSKKCRAEEVGVACCGCAAALIGPCITYYLPPAVVSPCNCCSIVGPGCVVGCCANTYVGDKDYYRTL